MKLYPRKSNNLVTTSVNTQLHIAKELVDYTQGFELSIDVYFDSATWDYSRYNWLCGRGNNIGFPSGMGAPGNGGNDFKCNWKNGAGLSVVSMESKPAGWYRVTMVVTPTTHQQKVQKLSTGEIFLGTAELNGTSTIGESVAFTLFSYGIDGTTGAYGSVGMNVSNVKITRNGATIFHLPLSEGNLAVVRDVVSKTAYTLGFFSISAGWAKLADFSHYNFKNGFTLYTKAANQNIYVPNDSTGAEIPWTPVLSYVKGANYKGTTTSYNQCESKFKLDDFILNQDLLVSGAGDSALNGVYPLRGQYNGRNWYYDGKLSGIAQWTHAFNWDGTQWVWCVNPGIIMFYGVGDVQTPFECTSWIPSSVGSLPVGTISYGGERCTLTGTLTPSDYNGEYHEIGLWTGNKLYGKVGDEENKHIWKSATPYDVYGWVIGAIESQGYWFEYINGNGNDNTPSPWDVASFQPFGLVGGTGTGVVVKNESIDNNLYLADFDHVLFTEGTGVAKEFEIGPLDVTTGYNRGYMYINSNVQEHDFMMYGNNKTGTNDLKVIKYIGLKDEVLTDESGEVIYDDDDHVILEG